MPATSNSPNPWTIGTGDSSSTRNPVAVASAAVAIVGAARLVARATAAWAPPAPPSCTQASWARAWNWMP